MVTYWGWIGISVLWLTSAPFAHRTKSSEGRLQRLEHKIPLLLGYLLVFTRHRGFFIYGPLYNTEWANWIVYPGILITASGCLFTVWARVHLGRYWSSNITLKEGHKIITTGPYRLVRHPIYTGLLTALFGTALTAGTGDALFGVSLATMAFLIKLRREEKLLMTEFGDEYRRFQQNVPSALVPFIY